MRAHTSALRADHFGPGMLRVRDSLQGVITGDRAHTASRVSGRSLLLGGAKEMSPKLRHREAAQAVGHDEDQAEDA